MQGLTLVFDLDGTLVDTAPDLIGATNYALATRSIASVAGPVLRPWISFGARRMIVEALSASSVKLAEPDVDTLLGRFLDYYEANIARESRPFAGSIEAIGRAREAGARISICTNKREGLSHALLGALGITNLFDAVAGRDTFAVSKPHPDHLLGAIRMAGGQSENAVMVGDSENDVLAARAAGVPVIGCSFGYSETPMADLAPDAILHHYDEFATALERVRARGRIGMRR